MFLTTRCGYLSLRDQAPRVPQFAQGVAIWARRRSFHASDVSCQRGHSIRHPHQHIRNRPRVSGSVTLDIVGRNALRMVIRLPGCRVGVDAGVTFGGRFSIDTIHGPRAGLFALRVDWNDRGGCVGLQTCFGLDNTVIAARDLPVTEIASLDVLVMLTMTLMRRSSLANPKVTLGSAVITPKYDTDIEARMDDNGHTGWAEEPGTRTLGVGIQVERAVV
jgi:hypothetical protein